MRKRVIAGILTVVMVVSSLQLQTVSVSASEMYPETEAIASVMEDTGAGTQKTEEETAAEAEDANAGAETQGEDAEGENKEPESGENKDDSDNDAANEDEVNNGKEEDNQGNEEGDAATEDADDESKNAEGEADTEDAEEGGLTGDADESQESEEEAEIEAEDEEAKMSVVTSDTDIASGTYTERGSDVSWVIDQNGQLTVEGTGEFARSLYPMRDSEVPWLAKADYITSAKIKLTGTTNAGCMFYNCQKLESIDLSEFDTSQVTDMRYMFAGCSGLTSLDLKNFNTGNVIDMLCMFSGCSGLTSLDLKNFDTSNVQNMGSMFGSCSGLTGLDLKNFNTGNVDDMGSMFYGCSGLTSLDLKNFDTSNVNNMNYMFDGCSGLTSLDLSNFDTAKVGLEEPVENYIQFGMKRMFYDCINLVSLDLSSFDTSNVADMLAMFKNCQSLVSLDISNFDIGSRTDTMYMFSGCRSLRSLDLSHFNNNINRWTIEYCSSLSTIYTPCNLSHEIELSWFGNVSNCNWYDCDGNIITCLPQNLDQSTVIANGHIPYISTLAAEKAKTAYDTGDVLNIDDLEVYYYNDQGRPERIAEGYSTNADRIDMLTPGRKILEITYNGMTAELRITVGVVYDVTFNGTGTDDIAEGAVQWAVAGEDYAFTLLKEKGYIYEVYATVNWESVTPDFDESANTYTVKNVNGNLVFDINKWRDTSGFKIWFTHKGDEESNYTGSAIKPEIEVYYDGGELVDGIDYAVKYSNNIKVGTAIITITGKGNYAKANNKTTFKIVERNIADVTISGVSTDEGGKESLTLAGGSALSPALYFNNIKLTAKDYVIKDEGGKVITGKKLASSDNGAKITIEGKSGGNFSGSREVLLNVVEKGKLTKFTVSVDKSKLASLVYDGKAHYIGDIEGALTVTAKDAAKTKMEPGRDYSIVYTGDLTNAGTKKFTVVGRGLYTGSVSKSYTVKPAKDAALDIKYGEKSVEGNRISGSFGYESTGVAFNDYLSIYDSGVSIQLREGRDYKVSYSGNKKVGKNAKCILSFLGNYKGHAKQTLNFEIVKADLSHMSLIIADQAYTGKKAIYKSVPYIIENPCGNPVLVKSSNYKVTYYTQDPTENANAPQMKGSNKVGAGDTVWVKVEAKGKNYSGSIVESYQVRETQNNLSKAKITFQDADGKTAKKTPYTGDQIGAAQIKAVVNGTPVVEDNPDIEVIYVNNVKKGKATVIVKGTGTGKYAGCKIATFSIVARSLN